MGSPPRVRGKLKDTPQQVLSEGITPARAGKTVYPGTRFCMFSDHPRACGEKHASVPAFRGSGGSPPRVRGKPYASDLEEVQNGITPARAGKTSCTGVASGALPDHPRACGEKHVESLSGTGALGSPPRMRGKQCNVEIAGKLRQITPCWKSIVAHIVRCVNKDRSPRVRGKHSTSMRSCALRRPLPARAGKTLKETSRHSSGEDHPRACGENFGDAVRCV